MALGSSLWAQEQIGVKPIHIVAWGDSEGMLRRPGDDPKNFNPAALKLIKSLQALDQERRIDLIVCTGDFVRFDPIPQKPKQFLFFKKWPKELLARFYPTMGGDEEFIAGKYAYFMREIGPWLKNTIPLESSLTALAQRAADEAKDKGKNYFYVERAGVHIFSLWSPDNLDELERTAQWADEDIFNPTVAPKTAQYRWLARNLWQIRVAQSDERPIIILSHRPVLNRSGEHLLRLFDIFDVDLVLSGDEHVYAEKNYRGVAYVVTGMMGDSLGGCDNLNKGYLGRRGNHFAQFIEPYGVCIPKTPLDRQCKPYEPADDHYLDITIESNILRAQAIRVDNGQEIEKAAFVQTLTRERDVARQNEIWQSVQ